MPEHAATARVATHKASRYLQALCGHFTRRVSAEYDAEQGKIAFGFGNCDLRAEPDALLIDVRAENDEQLARLKEVVGGHLERFAVKDALQVHWTDEPVGEERGR